MRDRVFFFGIGMVVTLALLPAKSFSQTPGTQNRIPQQITVNGQMASGAFVTTAGGQLQSFTCPTPQHYTTADGTSQGWACYEQTTGVWLLNALPPAPAQAPPAPQPAPQPPVVYQQAPPPVYQPAPQVVYAPPPAVVYQPAPAVVYQQPYPTVVYSQPYPTVVYAPAPRPVVVAPVYPSSVILGSAAINAAGRIASAVILNSHRGYYYYGGGRRW